MPTRNVVVTDRQASFIEKMVNAGRYQNASEVLREGLRMVEQREAENTAKLKALRAAAQMGIDSIEAGRYTAFDSPGALRVYLKAIADKAVNNA
jgi:antitoxin ParD1/3/4